MCSRISPRHGHDLLPRVLDWRQLAKLKSTYTDALPLAINPADRPRPYLLCAGCDLDRAPLLDRSQSAEHPDPHRGRPQDPPRLRRRSGTCPALGRLHPDRTAPGWRTWPICDALKEAFRDGDDIHAMTARRCSACRSRAWTRWSAAAPRRSISASSTASRPSASRTSSAFRTARRKAYIEAYFERYPGIRDYMERHEGIRPRDRAMSRPCSAGAAMCRASTTRTRRATSFMRTRRHQRAAPGHRRRHHQARHDPHAAGAVAAAGLKGRMLLQVHDELLFEVPVAEAAESSRVAREIMENAHLPARQISVPLDRRCRHGPQLGRGALSVLHCVLALDENGRGFSPAVLHSQAKDASIGRQRVQQRLGVRVLELALDHDPRGGAPWP